ncbi:hypothetical protein [Streptomyces sp. NPDC003395]
MTSNRGSHRHGGVQRRPGHRRGPELLVDDKWGPSIGLFQVRSLKHPGQYSPPDTLRTAAKLKDPLYNAKTAKAIKDAQAATGTSRAPTPASGARAM